MEIAVSSNSRINELVRYWQSRLPISIFVPLAVLLYAASLAAASKPTIVELVTNLLLSYTLVVQFRLLDDLADLRHDRFQYPDRVMSKAVSLGHYQFVVGLLFIINTLLIVLAKPVLALVLFIALTVTLQVWYTLPGRMLCRGIPNYHVVLLKYPLFVYVLAANMSSARAVLLIVAMVSVYLFVCIYEVVHDRRYYTRQSI
jgi:hypothetical protein